MKEDENEESAFSSSSFDSSFDDATMEKGRGVETATVGRGVETATVLEQSVAVRTTNKTKILQPYGGRRRREMEKAIAASS